MAEPISLASGLLTLAAFALQTGKLLFQTIESFKNSKRVARQLRDEVEALLQALEALEQVAADFQVELSTLKLPLLRCGIACKELSEIISNCTKHSDGQKTSLRDWTKVQYLGDDISHFKDILANYKATINIALGGATFRTVAVTSQVLQEYKSMIKDTSSDLEERLGEIEERLKALGQPEVISQSRQEELKEIEEERSSTTQCLKICDLVSKYIEHYQPGLRNKSQASLSPREELGESTTEGSYNAGTARQITDESLSGCVENIRTASSRLQKHLSLLETSLQNSAQSAATVEVRHQLQKIMEEKETIAHCLDICTDASGVADSPRVNIFEDVTSLDDSQQVLVSTIGDLLNIKRISTGMRSLQVLGQMSDDTLQSLSIRHGSPAESTETPDTQYKSKFQNRYGVGRQLQAKHQGKTIGTSE